VLRFKCPSCQSVLSGRDEQAGKIVTCPKCRQRMQTPRTTTQQTAQTAQSSNRTRRASSHKTPHRPLIAGCIFVVILLMTGTGGTIWWLLSSPSPKPEPVVRADSAPLNRVERAERTPTTPDKESGKSKNETHPTPRPPTEPPPTETPRPPAEPTPTEVPPPLPPPPPPLPVEGKKEIDLVGEMTPELPFDLEDAINSWRAKAGAEPIFLDAEASRHCQAKAELLARNAAKLGDKTLSANEKRETIATKAPLAAIADWMKEPDHRAAMLEPRLKTFGAGFARNTEGQWVSVFDWTQGLDREPLDAKPVKDAIVYPAPGQVRVPLWFPGNETPDPLPQTKEKLAGYPITLTFPPQARLENVVVHLTDKDKRALDVWLSTPEKPANSQFASLQQNTICLIAKKPLRPNARYRVEASATVNDKPWSATWDFETMSEGEIQHDMAGVLLRTLNGLRRRAGLPPVNLNAERAKACFAHARYLAQNAANHPMLNWNAEQADLPGYTVEGAAVAPRTSIQGGGGPVQAVAGLIDSLISRPQLLDPRLGELGLGYTPFMLGGWIWVIELRRVSERDSVNEYFYPAPDQENVPLVYPPNEVPSPVPAEGKGKLAGYAITALYGPQTPVTAATAKLVDAKGTEIEGWLSSPEKPAIARFPQRCLCFLPKSPLQPGMHYTATFEAEVNGRPWRRTWSFTTIKEPDRYADDLDEQILARVNAVRKNAGLRPVRFDADLSHACQAHAHYLALNSRHPATQGMGVHRQLADLPGASPAGAKAAKESVIAVLLDPRMCVEGWMATLYHRIPILTPNLERIGFSHAQIEGHKWVCVLDTGNGRSSSNSR
jgi:uncharacterized protein YkwD